MKPNQFKTILISLLIYCLIVQPIFASMPQLKSISETHGKQSAKYKVFITHDDIIIPGINEYAYLDLEFSEWIELVDNKEDADYEIKIYSPMIKKSLTTKMILLNIRKWNTILIRSSAAIVYLFLTGLSINEDEVGWAILGLLCTGAMCWFTIEGKNDINKKIKNLADKKYIFKHTIIKIDIVNLLNGEKWKIEDTKRGKATEKKNFVSDLSKDIVYEINQRFKNERGESSNPYIVYESSY